MVNQGDSFPVETIFFNYEFDLKRQMDFFHYAWVSEVIRKVISKPPPKLIY